MMKAHIIKGLLAFFLALIAQTAVAQALVTNVVYVNGIQNTLEGAQETQVKIQTVLDSSPNHAIGIRRFFSVHVVWNPIGWYGTDQGADLSQDTMELFVLKTAEENFTQNFQKLLAPYNQSSIVDKSAALEVAKYLDNMLPGSNSLETDKPPKIDDEKMSATQRATQNLIARIKHLNP